MSGCIFHLFCGIVASNSYYSCNPLEQTQELVLGISLTIPKNVLQGKVRQQSGNGLVLKATSQRDSNSRLEQRLHKLGVKIKD